MRIGETGLFTIADLERAFQGAILRVRVPWLYRTGLVGVACCLVLLQAIYVGMVILSAWLTFWYIGKILSMADAISFVVAPVALAGPAAIGAIVTFFLFKPLLSKAPKPEEPMELRRENAETLFYFAEHVCSMIGAAAPRSISVNLEVNAFAGLRRGWRSLASRDLTLIIGLPLAAGLTVRQFAGVLAHEFGHFSQTAGMRAHFLIGHVLYWFGRVAHDRDKWDLWLERRLHRTEVFSIRTVLQAATWIVSLSRLMLWCLLWLATWISAWFGRQMEFDADRYEASLVGGDTTAEFRCRFGLLAAASERSWQNVNEAWRYKRLPKDFTALVQHHETHMVPATREVILHSLMSEQAGRWDTHPTTAERIENVKGIQGVLTERLDQPAVQLFPDFWRLSREVTDHHFRQTFGQNGEGKELVDTDVFLNELAAGERRQRAKDAVFSPMTHPSHWFVLRADDDSCANEESIATKPEGDDEYTKILQKSLSRHAGLQCLRAWGRIRPSYFDLSSEERAVVEREVRESREALSLEAKKLREKYYGSGFRLASGPRDLRYAYAAISSEQDALQELRHSLEAASVLLNNLNHLDATRITRVREIALKPLETTCREILGRLEHVPCPIALPGLKSSSVGRQLSVDCSESFELAQTVLLRTDDLAERLLGELCLASGAGTEMESVKKLATALVVDVGVDEQLA